MIEQLNRTDGKFNFYEEWPLKNLQVWKGKLSWYIVVCAREKVLLACWDLSVEGIKQGALVRPPDDGFFSKLDYKGLLFPQVGMVVEGAKGTTFVKKVSQSGSVSLGTKPGKVALETIFPCELQDSYLVHKLSDDTPNLTNAIINLLVTKHK